MKARLISDFMIMSIVAAIAALLVIWLIKVGYQPDTTPEYTLTFPKEGRVVIKSINTNNIYVTTMDSIQFYIKVDNSDLYWYKPNN